ncbi:uncharacterized protein LOC116614781 isoform X2 [Nematostella vectensis]|uniref:uncharacterized protein LOC116614781 isoform X2 n=2 Tax=Nematostella vectensis TaxID=45351 RepID=UPI0020775B84|nr:uncharacterized protein LOC116614781 isoform X2 [Nematostella vectensis]
MCSRIPKIGCAVCMHSHRYPSVDPEKNSDLFTMNVPENKKRENSRQERRALLVGPTYEGLDKKFHLEGTANDVKLITDLITHAPFCFPQENIKILVGGDATRSSILTSLESLCQDAAEESVVLFFFCGHGFYLRDIKDEGIVPSDITTRMLINNAVKDVCITGKDFASYLELLASKEVFTTLMFDCCYSGHVYRDAEYKDSMFTPLRPRQIEVACRLQSRSNSSPGSPLVEPSLNAHLENNNFSMWPRSGWRPSRADRFVHIAACSSAEKAYEGVDHYTDTTCGLLTCAVRRVFGKLSHPEKVSYKVLCSLIMREFKELHVSVKQTPQFEGGNLNTRVFDRITVPDVHVSGVPVDRVFRNGSRDEVILEAGILQLLRDGEYEVFEPTVTKEELACGNSTEKWVARIDVNQYDIFETQALALVVEKAKDIRPGCLAFLREARSVRHKVRVHQSTNHVNDTCELLTQLKTAQMFHVECSSTEEEEHFTSAADDTFGHMDTITLMNFHNAIGLSQNKILNDDNKKVTNNQESHTQTTVYRPECRRESGSQTSDDIIHVSPEQVHTSKAFWVARRRGKMITPPISLGREHVVVDNLCRLLRYEMALANADIAFGSMINVTFKVSRLERVQPYRAGLEKSQRIREGLSAGDLYEGGPVTERPRFRAHLVTQRSDRGRVRLVPVPCSGDALVFQVTNNEDHVIHVCVLMFQLDGSVVSLYPDSNGRTQELRPGDSIEDIHRLFIPDHSLRGIARPDPRDPEPRYGVDTVVLFATSEEASYLALLQTPLETEPELVPRALDKQTPLHPLRKFRLALTNRCSLDAQCDSGPAWQVMKREFEVWKHPQHQ